MHPSLHISYKNFDLKQDCKEGRGGRTEGSFRNPKDFDVNKGLSNLPYRQKIGRQINRRLREVERVSHNSGWSGDIHPTRGATDRHGKRCEGAGTEVRPTPRHGIAPGIDAVSALD